NEQFASALPGWKTDRGRIYIMYGPPDQIESHLTGGPYTRPTDEGGGDWSSYPFETWHYRYLEGTGQEVDVEFVDVCRCNDYRVTIDPSHIDPAAGAASPWMPDYVRPQQDKGKTPKKPVLQVFVGAQKPPPVQFKELQEILNVKMRYNDLPYTVHTDIGKIT